MRYVIGIGASGAHAEARVRDGLARLRDLPSSIARVVSISRAYANPAFGGVTHDRFVNAAAVIESPLAVAALLHSLHAIERAVGRVRGAKNGARALDLDVLLALDAVGPLSLVVNGATGAAGVTAITAVPHPRLHERASAVVPAVEAIERAGACAVPASLRIAANAADAAVRGTLVALDGHGFDPFSSSPAQR